MKDLIDIEAEARVLAPSERLEKFCEVAAAAYRHRVQHETLLASLKQEEDTLEPNAKRDIRTRVQEMDNAAFDAEQELVARAKLLHADGTFDRCIDILQIETAGTP